MAPNGEQICRLTEQPKYDGKPAWSTDGKRITFVSYRDLKQIPERGVIRREIYVMNADGTNPSNLTQDPDNFDLYPPWRPASTLSVASEGKLATLWGKVKGSR